MIYLNNAATTWPKPEIVYKTVDETLRATTSPERASNNRETRIMLEARKEIASFFGIRDASRLVFMPSCTYALNLAILGLDWRSGDRVIMSGLEHHAVSRPVRKVAREKGIRFEIAPYPFRLEWLEGRLEGGKVKLVAFTMASNVTGEILPTREIGALARRYGALHLVDAAQAAGVVPVDVESLHADLLAVAGHKGLFGPPGIGGLYVREGLSLNTLAEGGTGKDSGKHPMSGAFPSTFEVGTHNLPAIAGLAAGVRWVRDAGESIRGLEGRLTRRFLRGLQGVRVYGPQEPESRTAVVSITIEGISPFELSRRLADENDIVTRAGYHCAPLAHETIGTLPGDGTLRFSFGPWNTAEEVDAVLEALAVRV